MNSWLLLILSLPTENASTRMRAWRALKAAGAAVLRDGVYVLPASEEHRDTLGAVAADVEGSGGTAYLLELDQPTTYPFAELFDRTTEYTQLAEEITTSLPGVDDAVIADALRQARKLHKSYAAVRTIDFFPGDIQRQVEALLAELDRRIQARSSLDEPSTPARTVPHCDPAQYQGRLWATRKRLWVDRVASAWLIWRFIDHEARFIWLDNPADCPNDALGFDFDGAAFTHTETTTGILVSFETLMMSFDLERDSALQRIARLVHYLDIGGLPMPEAAGFERLLRGMRARIDNDNTLLIEAGRLLDDFYTAFAEETPSS
jgi:hypothetical protein